MGNEQNATPNQPSLLDRIHLFREFAKSAGWSDVAEWLTKHADEPCPAAIAEFMDTSGPCGDCSLAEIARPHNMFYRGVRCGAGVNCGHTPRCHPYRAVTVTPPSEPSRTEAVKEAIALVGGRWIAHEGCDRASGVCRQSDKRVCDVVQAASILLTALADAERKLATAYEPNQIRDEIMEALSAKLAAAEQRAGEIHELPRIFMLGEFRHKVTAVEGHYDGSYIVAQKIGEFDPPTKPLPLPSELVAAAEKRAKDATIAKNLSSQVRDRTGVQLIEANNQIAALTRKLATAREGIAKATTCGHRAGCYHAPPCTHIEILRETVAAIDAPAGEEAGANGRGVSVTPLPPSDQMCDFTYWATAPPGITKPMRAATAGVRGDRSG